MNVHYQARHDSVCGNSSDGKHDLSGKCSREPLRNSVTQPSLHANGMTKLQYREWRYCFQCQKDIWQDFT